MPEPQDDEPRRASPDFGPSSLSHKPAQGLLSGLRAVFLPSVLAAAAIAAALVLGSNATSSLPKPAPTPATPLATTAPPVVAPAPTVVEAPPAAQPEVRAPARPEASPQPSPAPDPVRPLTGPVMPLVVNSPLAPTHKPGTPDPDPTTDHVIVVDADSGAVLFQRNAYEPVAPASLTKIMTAILGIEHGKLSDHVKVDVDARQMDGSSLMGLEPWFDVTFQDLLYGLMLPSGNDAALAIAHYVAGSDAAFVRLMNQKASQLGLRCTHFANPHGLDTSDHYSCPADMVTMARYAMQYPIFREVVATRSYDISESNIAYTIQNVNPILGYPGADGVKTGFTDSAGRALVGTAVQNGHRVYVAFMRSDNGAAADGALLLNWAFNSFTWYQSTPLPDRR